MDSPLSSNHPLSNPDTEDQVTTWHGTTLATDGIARTDLLKAKIYEPRAPAPSQRLATLQAAREAGLHVYAAIAPTYPECDAADFHATLAALRPLDPVTLFHEPINIRAENVQRIARHAAQLGITLRTEVFATRSAWQNYALTALRTMRQIAEKLGLQDCLHSWPDPALGSAVAVHSQANPRRYLEELQQSWSRISEWP